MVTALLAHFAAGCAEGAFFGLPTWYKYLLKAGKMQVVNGRCEFVASLKVQDLSLIGLALVDIALRIAALVTVAYVIYGGVLFVTAQGEPDRTKRARQTIINALIGLGVTLAAVGFVTFIGARVGQ